jgi:hypothetical protein
MVMAGFVNKLAQNLLKHYLLLGFFGPVLSLAETSTNLWVDGELYRL